MYERLFIGNKLVELEEIDSTNTYLQELVINNENEIEGIVVVANNQYSGKGQRGNNWISEQGENLTFSILLKPNIEVKNQFLISKVVSLGIIDFLLNKGLENVKIKWPNDIYCNENKLSGVLIENSIKGSRIYNSIVGIGLNVNQTKFSSLVNVTSLKSVIRETLNLKESLDELLFFIEKRYLILKAGKVDLINSDYLTFLYWINESKTFLIDNKNIEGVITGVSSIGKLQLEINKQIREFDLKEIKFKI
ncbi:MAG: biotin--[acetyl-CoA-carboxylase] ligase [Flavobacteriales bacterium]|nr:biotin--[acetyl-CoA-carboxylase] ligase [Flavobacteriales bacterium]